MNAYDPLYVAYLYYFNVTRDYFECHEVLEELWMQDGRNPLWQGLLQVAVGLYHHRNGNVSGAGKLLRAAVEKLASYPPETAGMNLGRLVAESRDYAQRLQHEEGVVFRDLTIEIVDPELEEQVDRLRAHPPVPHDES